VAALQIDNNEAQTFAPVLPYYARVLARQQRVRQQNVHVGTAANDDIAPASGNAARLSGASAIRGAVWLLQIFAREFRLLFRPAAAAA